MRAIVRNLVVLDNDQSGNQSIEREVVKDEMRDCALVLLVGGMGWSEEKDGLCEDEKTAGVEERVGREEDERLEKYAGPDGGCEEDDAGLCDYCCA